MFKYRLNKTLLGLRLIVAVFFDAQSVASFEGIIAKAMGLGDKVIAYAFWPEGEPNKKLEQTALSLGIKLVGVEVEEAGDQAVDDCIRQWIGRVEGAGEANVIVVPSSDNGYLKAGRYVRLGGRAFVVFRHGKMLKANRSKCDCYYDLKGMEYVPNETRWTARERCELLILAREALAVSFKKKGRSLVSDAERYFDHFQPDWKERTQCASLVELLKSLKGFWFSDLEKKEEWVKEVIR
nr:hypothetical protein [uncultured Pseudodesulfovibrio sp.]